MPSKSISALRRSLSQIYKELISLACCITGLIKVKLFFSESDNNWLEIGAGISRKQGVITSDLDFSSDYPFDLRVGLPFPKNSLDFIYAEHVLEHFDRRVVMKLLEECKRAMKPGAVLSVSVPNARIYLDAYAKPETFDYHAYCTYDTGLDYRLKIDAVNYMFYMDGWHRHMFDEESLLHTLTAAGFSDVCSREFDPDLDRQERKFESIYARCIKNN